MSGRGRRAEAAQRPEPRSWSVVIPVKPAAIGKSRLAVPGVDREALARAIALDTIAAASRARLVAEVVVVTNDADVRAAIARAGGFDSALRAPLNPSPFRASRSRRRAVGDQASSSEHGEPRQATAATVRAVADPGTGLNAAIAAGLAAATGPARAALLGDLPALRPGDLDDALRRATGPAAVADADGTGTTLFAHAEADLLAFGADSYARHLAAGAVALDVDPASTLRHDVDTAAQLDAARALGLGPRTAALLP
ncbi:hypothetical protein [Microbacterium sediminis]|uniref:Uncharacterized protein n=1 Tax=Microbacterium sediminis TaxID=904291 RepID=A0A1B9NE35_9MICO|nr:hypothetical protein [Microbacterium sediminis]OCG74840.1 hypothetical protein A7J15_04810 [Microbacterium sediminis]QBR75142.1 2-phospho-L-lactate guanylyltransferase [Microbacterium sediminis]